MLKRVFCGMILLTLSFALSACFAEEPKNTASDTPKTTTSSESESIDAEELAVEWYSVVNEEQVLVDAFQTANAKVYVYRIGRLSNVPVYSGIPTNYTGGELSVYMEDANITSQSIEQSIEQCRTAGVESSIEGTVGVGTDAEISILNKEVDLKAEASVSKGLTNTMEMSTSVVSTTVNEWAQERVNGVSQTLNDSYPDGWYCWTLFAECDVFTVVVYEDGAFSCENMISILPETLYFKLDYSEDRNFGAQQNEKIEFNVALLNDLDVEAELDRYVSVFSIESVLMERKNCKCNNKYDASVQDTAVFYHHEGFELGDLQLLGCEKVGSKYRVVDKSKFALQYKLLHSPDKLPTGDEKKTLSLFKDEETGVVDTGLENVPLGEGAYWLRVFYKDGSAQTKFSGCDLLNGAVQGDIFTLVDMMQLSANKEVASIEIVFVYELKMYIEKDGFGTLNDKKEYSAWRCSAIIDFT